MDLENQHKGKQGGFIISAREPIGQQNFKISSIRRRVISMWVYINVIALEFWLVSDYRC